jgi:hypothetical protein
MSWYAMGCVILMFCARPQVRGELQAALEARMPERNWGFITKQIGMFSFTGMTPAQVRGGTPGGPGQLCLTVVTQCYVTIMLPSAPMHLPRVHHQWDIPFPTCVPTSPQLPL